MERGGGGGEGHLFWVIMTHYVRKSTCDSPLTEFKIELFVGWQLLSFLINS